MNSNLSKYATKILKQLREHYTKEKNDFILWTNPLELLIGTVLSAQCTDKKVNQVTRTLFQKYHTALDYQKADINTLEEEIYSIGFYKTKARYLKGIGTILVKRYGGEVPPTVQDLISLPGVSYKTAHLIMAKAFHKSTGVAVDTHVKRLAPRLGFTKHKTPQKIAHDLENLFDHNDYLDVNEYLILHGRSLCKGVPQCGSCFLSDMCPTARKILKL